MLGATHTGYKSAGGNQACSFLSAVLLPPAVGRTMAFCFLTAQLYCCYINLIVMQILFIVIVAPSIMLHAIEKVAKWLVN